MPGRRLMVPQSRRSAARARQHRRPPRSSAAGRIPVLDGDPGARWLWLAPPPRFQHLAGWALLPLRVFLGVTFCFAGLQKLANPAFFNASSPISIQAQLAGAARHSPIHSILSSLGHVAVPLGLLIAFGELAAGLGTLAGLWARVAAAGGAAISFGLFLTVSFHTNPYYTGSDIVFLFAWLPLLVAGAGPLSADAVLSNLARKASGLRADTVVPIAFAQVRAVCGVYSEGTCQARHGEACEPGPCPFLAHDPQRLERPVVEDVRRRAFLAKATMAAGAAVIGLVGGGIVAGISRLAGRGSSAPGTPNLGAASGSPTTPRTPSGPPRSATPGTTPPGVRLGPASMVPVGGAARFTDPASGDPALVVQPRSGTFLAFDAICPHAGCIVQYSAHDGLFICPCHGSEFNGRNGAVETGPAQSGLAPIAIAEGPDGDLYAK